jgi:sulfopyruvate decarboxylase TPP-binding subunit
MVLKLFRFNMLKSVNVNGKSNLDLAVVMPLKRFKKLLHSIYQNPYFIVLGLTREKKL